ncbi:TlpA family protein disulfide reductase [Sphingomonas ginkgonis]|uniref:TlpA family protein disulfide reductase n=1 Tax=Sphingomonas ginkgonis TaxID=2315330 RepID=A0A3R9YIY3_9SPHN|nr:TlpA disulfide reductase family protein [Sphingomonas ginkgonis]RST30934.1 TlpA family protein disulfide reductase [Sphingomonas ginkgonis]
MSSLLRLIFIGLVLAAAPAEAGTPKLGELAPDFNLTLVDGHKVALSELRGKVVVLNFWATWCGPCRQELPLLDAYYKAQVRFGLRVFAVTTEDSLPLYQLRKLFAVMHIPPVRGVRGAYDAEALPTNFVIDRSGHLRYAKPGAFNLGTLNGVLVPLLREPPPAGTSAN